MKFKVSKNQLTRNLRDALRGANYFGIQDSRSGNNSFVRVLARNAHYPRFHLYIDETNDSYQFNLHLDQKKPIYSGQKAHNADYDEPAVQEEAERIQSMIQ